MKKLKEEAKMKKLKDKSKDNKIREQAQVIKDLKRKLSEKKVELSAKKSVVHNLTRKLYAERIQFNQERQQLDEEWEEERERNTKLIRKYRDLKRNAKDNRDFMDEVRQSLDAFAGVGVNEHSHPMNDLRWLHETGRMHLIKYEHRAQIGKWLRDAIRADESDAEDSAAEDSEDTEASTTVTIVAATRT
jgi:hypothetical protein